MNSAGYAYSHSIPLYSGHAGFDIKVLNNPFDNYLSFDAGSPVNEQATVSLFDNLGRLVLEQRQKLYTGSNKIVLSNLAGLSGGSYFLRIQTNTQFSNKKIVKIKN